MAGGHQLKKLAQSRSTTGFRWIDCKTKHWSMYTLVFSVVSLLLFCFLFIDVRSGPTLLFLHASKELGVLRAQVGDSYIFSVSRSSPVEVVIGDGKTPWELLDDSGNVGKEQTADSNESPDLVMIESEAVEISPVKVPKESLEAEIPLRKRKSSESSGSEDNELLRQVEKSLKSPKLEETDVLQGEERFEKDIQEQEKGNSELSTELEDRDSQKKEKHSEPSNVDEKDLSRQKEKRSDVLQELRDYERCDFSVGKWVYDETYPLYKPNRCPFVDGGFRCVENGRPSDEFQKWRWQPSGCDLPRFDAKKILERLRGQRMAFVGDSIGRNNWESMLCMLSEAVENKSRVYEINGEPITKHTGFLSFRFEDYNCTVEYYRSPYLVPQGRAPPKSDARVRSTLKLDQIDWSSSKWRDADIVILNSGHWWSFEKTVRSGNYFQEGMKVYLDMDVGTAFAKAMRTVALFVETNMDPNKTQVFFRSYAPVHFKGGTWDHGGTCHDDNKPLAKFPFIYEDKTCNQMISEIMKSDGRNAVNFVNITYMSDLRPDGHSSIYQRVPPSPKNHQDCSHWCLPGVPDTWNEILFATLLQKRQGSWAQSR